MVKQSVQKNDAGDRVAPGRQEEFRHRFYCSQHKDIPGSDGQCGPSNGPQCRACKRFQASVSVSPSVSLAHLSLTSFNRMQTFSSGDKVLWVKSDSDIPSGSVGTVRGPSSSREGFLALEFSQGGWGLPAWDLRRAHS